MLEVTWKQIRVLYQKSELSRVIQIERLQRAFYFEKHNMVSSLISGNLIFLKYVFIYYGILHGVSDQIFILIDKKRKIII